MHVHEYRECTCMFMCVWKTEVTGVISQELGFDTGSLAEP